MKKNKTEKKKKKEKKNEDTSSCILFKLYSTNRHERLNLSFYFPITFLQTHELIRKHCCEHFVKFHTEKYFDLYRKMSFEYKRKF